MRRVILLAIVSGLFPGFAAAQPARPNEAGVTMGHLHLNTSDVPAAQRLFSALGGTSLIVDDVRMVRFRGLDVYLHPQPPAGGSAGTAVDHVAFRVPSAHRLAERLEGVGVRLEDGWITTRDGLRIEVIEEDGQTLPAIPDHVHFSVPRADLERAESWYAAAFGGTPASDGGSRTVELPGTQIVFDALGSSGGTRGRALDRIAVRVVDVEAFARKLEAAGARIEQPFAKNPRTGRGSAVLTDPWGAAIELTEMIGP